MCGGGESDSWKYGGFWYVCGYVNGCRMEERYFFRGRG